MRHTFVPVLVLAFAIAGRAAAEDKAPAPKDEPVYQGRKIGEWMRLFKDGDVVDRQGAVYAFTQIGGAAAVPPLTEALGDKKITNDRLWAAYGLRRIGPAAKAAVPQLELALKDDYGLVRVEAAKALWAISEHKSAIPALIGLLKAKEVETRVGAAEALERIGPKAKAAVPALLEALTDSGVAEYRGPASVERKSVNGAACKALRKIDPEAAKKAGID